MAEKRKGIGQKTRFEVFKRDKFTCQYCGRMSPDVVLEIDHIKPVAEGGNNNILNLVTSCFDCNRGKGKRKLDDSSEIKKQQAELKMMSDKKEQLEMMIEWRKELNNIKNQQIDFIEQILIPDGSGTLNDFGRSQVASLIRRFGFNEVCEATEISVERYSNCGLGTVVNKIGGICYNRENGRGW